MPLNTKVKRGLGIGCAVLFVGFMMLFGGTVYFAKQMGRQYKAVQELETQLVESLGASNKLPSQHTGLPAADRVEAFLAVRQSSSEWRLKVETSFAELFAREGQEEAKGIRHFFRIVKASRDLAPVFSGFWTSRNQALLEQQMGMGEYIYLYCLAFYSWLGEDPSDGARDAGAFLSGLGATGTSENRGDSQADEEERRRWARGQVNNLLLPLLQQAARQATETPDPDLLFWAEAMQVEIDRLQDDPQRVPFADGVPEELAQVLEPYRSRFEASYSVTVNPVELIFEDTWQEEQ